MNIFYLSSNPAEAAQSHCDKHVVKMIVETAQLLSTAHWATGSKGPYRKTHINHPSAVWVRSSLANYRWLCQLGLELCYEYTRRYSRRHKSQDSLEWLSDNEPELPDAPFSDPPQCMPDDVKCDDTVTAYRTYYRRYKAHMAQWRHSDEPAWWSV